MRVTIVEFRDSFGPTVAHVASSRGKALAFIRANTDYGGYEKWHWAIYEELVDNPDIILADDNLRYYDKHGNETCWQPVY